MGVEEKQIPSLIQLLDDPDNKVYEHVAEELKSLGTEVIPTLENAWESSPDTTLQERLEELIHSIQFEDVQQGLRQWSVEESDDLLKGACQVARYHYPELHADGIRRKLDVIKKEIWLELSYYLTPLEQVNVFNHVFYSLNGMGANTSDLQDPQNFFINHVLDVKKGNAISLGVIYLILARSLDMPVYGVNLPHHFVLAYCKNFIENMEDEEEVKRSVIFYINPLNKGAIFSRNEIKQLLNKLELEHEDEYFLPCGNRTVIARLLEDLQQSYQTLENREREEEIRKLAEEVKD